jgi:hypothetical protein
MTSLRTTEDPKRNPSPEQRHLAPQSAIGSEWRLVPGGPALETGAGGFPPPGRMGPEGARVPGERKTQFWKRLTEVAATLSGLLGSEARARAPYPR